MPARTQLPHERGLLPMLPSDFCCNAIADPKARFCCRRLPIDIRHWEPAYPFDTRALNFALMVAPWLLGPAEGANICAL